GELITKAQVSLFYMYNSERFLKYAKKYLDIDIEQESIKQVQEIAQLRRIDLESQSIHLFSYHVEQAVSEWVKQLYPEDELTFSNSHMAIGVDLIRTTHEGTKIGYEIKYSKSPSNTNFFAELILRRASTIIERYQLNELVYVIAFQSESLANRMKSRIIREKLPEIVSVVFGYIAASDTTEGIKLKFVPL
ncbi:MAG: hypothetical protein HC889_18090, partial [Synechococcaceae cyanobacterium SM1_2_3]|nr:hypothetical protein [Synechococcaceae cyanobacterium SM1_2_3]